MPLGVAAMIFQGDDILHNIGMFQDTGNTVFLYIALRKFASSFDGLADMLLEVSKHFEEGAKKYGDNNWQKGIPVRCYINSAVRHYLKWLRQDDDEPHNRALCWNIMCAIWTCEHKPELNDYHKQSQFDPDDLMGEYEEEND